MSEVTENRLEKPSNPESTPINQNSESTKIDIDEDFIEAELNKEEEQAKMIEAAKKTQIFTTFNLQKFMMEFMGSFALIFFGNWAQIFSDLGMSNQIAVSLVIGLFMMVFTWIGTDISGAHFNPITTVTHLFTIYLTYFLVLNDDSQMHRLEHRSPILDNVVPWRTRRRSDDLHLGP
jgi:hypothetical protein